MDDDPLVVPRCKQTRFQKDLGRIRAALGTDIVDGTVMKLEEGGSQPAQDQVLIIARIANEGGRVRRAVQIHLTGQVLEEPAEAEAELGRVGRIIQVGTADRT
jgi:hypothetical protein